MEDIKLSSDEYRIKYRAEEIQLLKKEFQLFECLYRNPGRVFTRIELLDLVWAQEDPTDRTVDDHIYRIRKKLISLSSIVNIETIRGSGYRLKLSSAKDVSPLKHDDEVFSSMKMLFHKYHLYGQGDALKLLEEHQSVLGFDLDLQSRLYLKFMNGDFRWIAEAADVSFWDRCFYLLHIYSYIEKDKKRCLAYFRKALLSGNVPEEQRFEIEWLNQLPLLIFTGQLEEAETHLKESIRVIHEKKLEGFIPNLYFIELYLMFSRKDFDLARKRIREIEVELEGYPFSREKAAFMVIKGIEFLYNGDEAEAKHFFDQSLDLILQSRYIPGLFISLHIILFFLADIENCYVLKQSYEKRLKQCELDYKLRGLEKLISHQLDAYL